MSTSRLSKFLRPSPVRLSVDCFQLYTCYCSSVQDNFTIIVRLVICSSPRESGPVFGPVRESGLSVQKAIISGISCHLQYMINVSLPINTQGGLSGLKFNH